MYSINDLKEKFNNKKVLITGHTGFKGSYLCVLLNLFNAKVYGYALKPEKNSLYEILTNEINDKLVEKEVFDDIRNYDAIYNFIKEVDPDFIIHMAAQPLVIEGYKNPKYTFDVNVMGTVNLLEAIRCIYCAGTNVVAHPLSILNVTTDKVYENKDIENYKFKEDDKLMGDDPYANSKSCSELVTHSYKKSFFDENKNITISCARAGNVIGGGDFADNRIVPDIYRAYVANKNVELRNQDSTRPYQFVLEPLIVYLNILMYQYENIDDKNKYEGCYNVGPDVDDILTTRELAEKVCESFTKNGAHTVRPYEKTTGSQESEKEKRFLCLDNTLIKNKFSYKKIFTNDEMIENTVKVYEGIHKKERILPIVKRIIYEL